MTELVQETKLFNLSTRSKACHNLNGDWKSQCEYIIPNMIERDESIEYIQFSVPDAVIPVSIYNVNENNCVISVTVNGVITSYTFPLANYSALTFVTTCKSLLGNTFNITFNHKTSVFSITNTVADFTLNANSTIGSVMGFSNSVNSVSKSVTLPRCCNFLPLPRITLRCAELANTCMVGSTTSSDVIITIPTNSGNNGQIYYQNQSNAKLLFRHHELSQFIISFTDDDGNLLNFNGLSSFFTLQFDIYRRYVPKPPRFGSIVDHANKNAYYYPDEEYLVSDNI